MHAEHVRPSARSCGRIVERGAAPAGTIVPSRPIIFSQGVHGFRGSPPGSEGRMTKPEPRMILISQIPQSFVPRCRVGPDDTICANVWAMFPASVLCPFVINTPF